MRNIRLAWALLTLGVGTLALISTWMTSWRAYQFTSCETDPGSDPVACYESLLDRAGGGLIVALLLPVALCLLPVAVPRRSIAWATVGALAATAIIVFVTVGGAAVMPAVTAVLAGILAGGHTRLTTQHHAPDARHGREFLKKLHQGQQDDR
ncbi:hypothetical protein [Rhodococcus triatomae]